MRDKSIAKGQIGEAYIRSSRSTSIVTVAPDLVNTPFVFPANCNSSDAVGDCVYVTGDAIGGVIQVAAVDVTDPDKMPALGIIRSKSGPTDCVVAFLGGVPVDSDLNAGQVVFVGNDGRPSALRPVSLALVQLIGVALDSSLLMFNPSPIMTFS